MPSSRYPTLRCHLCRRPIRQRVGLRVWVGVSVRTGALLGEAVHVGCFRHNRDLGGRFPDGPSCGLCGEVGAVTVVSLVYFDRRGSFREGPALTCHMNCIKELLGQPGGLEILMLRESSTTI